MIEARRVLEIGRTNDLPLVSGYMGGFGDLLSRIADALEARE